MSELSDESRQSVGAQASMALDSVGLAIWKRSAEILLEAEKLHQEGQLTAERANSLLIALVEQRNIEKILRSQVVEGARAANRLRQKIEKDEARREAEKRAKTHGLNRFVQSKVPSNNSTVDR